MNNYDVKKMAECSLGIILYAGNAHSSCMEAIQLAGKNRFDEANSKLADAKEEFANAHNIQTDLLTENAKLISNDQPGVNPDILMVHAQDHFNSAYICIDLCEIICDLQKQIFELKEEINEMKK